MDQAQSKCGGDSYLPLPTSAQEQAHLVSLAGSLNIPVGNDFNVAIGTSRYQSGQWNKFRAVFNS